MIKFPIYLRYIKQRLSIVFGEAPYGIKTDARITKKLLREAKPVNFKPSPLVEAIKYAKALKEPSIVSKMQVARRFGISRARVCQMLNLLELDKRILKYLMELKNPEEINYFTERKLRPLAMLSGQEQIESFRDLLKGFSIII
ncbi:MAG: hypothetical protein U9Q21_00375 [Candidatus Auribacterota bacterium]|nr:hypothetical protein [Candidatus Auribacterota bacterium]